MSRLWKIYVPVFVVITAAAIAVVDWRRNRERDERAEEVPLDLDPKNMRGLSRVGSGFLVWERRTKSGAWEIWSKRLNGGKERRLVPTESGRDHFCPKISPDGKRVAYLSYPRGSTGYPGHVGRHGVLWVMDLKSRKRRAVAPEARSYAEHRAVVWRSEDRLCFIDNKGFTQEFSLSTGQTTRLLKQPSEVFGYLMSPDGKHATSGTPEFARVDTEAQTLWHEQRQSGCQPYFTADSKWGFWMGGAGGPVNKMRLATREVSQILQKDDERMHGKRNYIYFPMISPCQRLIAFGASPDSHDHFEADYDLYLAHLNPVTLEIIGKPVRYTSFKGTDRYPDVFRTELPLGSQYVEGETTLDFAVKDPGEGKWGWHMTGNVNYEGDKAQHTFKKPGDYWIEARHLPDGGKLRGYVHVSPPAPPKVEGARREGKDGIVVDFDEPVESSEAIVKLADGTVLKDWKLSEGDLSLMVKLPDQLKDAEALVIEGFKDRAQQPNRMAATALRVPKAAWPATDEGLVFVWEQVRGLTKLPNGNPCTVVPHGVAFWDQRGAMKLRGGWFDAPEAGELVSSECRKTHEVSLEMVITPQGNVKEKEDRRILTLANNDQERNLTIIQRGPRLFLWMRTPANGPAGDVEETSLAVVQKGYPHHLVLAYGKDKLTVYVDGQAAWTRNRITGDFSNWESMKMRLGASSEGKQPWRGEIERVLIYNRKLSDEEVAQHANSSIVMSGQRLPVKEGVVWAKLVEMSPTPTLQEFQPYTEALVSHLYEVTELVEGAGDLGVKVGDQIVVSQWSWMGAQPLPAQKLQLGQTLKLRLQRPEDHPELGSLFVKEGLSSGFDAPTFHDVGDWDAALEGKGS